MTTPDELRAQRDKARDIACHLEAENARLLETIQRVKDYANGLLSEWAGTGYGATLLAIVNGEHES